MWAPSGLGREVRSRGGSGGWHRLMTRREKENQVHKHVPIHQGRVFTWSWFLQVSELKWTQVFPHRSAWDPQVCAGVSLFTPCVRVWNVSLGIFLLFPDVQVPNTCRHSVHSCKMMCPFIHLFTLQTCTERQPTVRCWSKAVSKTGTYLCPGEPKDNYGSSWSLPVSCGSRAAHKCGPMCVYARMRMHL